MREKPRTFPSKLNSNNTANSISSPSKEQNRKSPSPNAANSQRRLSNSRQTRSNGINSKPSSREELHTTSTTPTTPSKSAPRGKSPGSKESLTSKTTARLEKQASLHAERSQGRRPASPMRVAVAVKSSVRDSPFRQSDSSGDPVQSNSHRSHRHSSNNNATPVIKSRTSAASVQKRAAQFSGKNTTTSTTPAVAPVQNGNRTKHSSASVVEGKKTARMNSADKQKPSITTTQTNTTTTSHTMAPIDSKTSRANIEIKMNKPNESNMVVEVEINSGAVQNVTVVSQSSPPVSQTSANPAAATVATVSPPREKSAEQKRKLDEDLAALQKERDLDLEQREQREVRRREREQRRELELQQQMEKDVKQGVLGRYDPNKSRPSHTPTASTAIIGSRIADTKLLFVDNKNGSGASSNASGLDPSPRESPLPTRAKANSKFSEMQSRFNSGKSKQSARPNSSYSKTANKVVLPGKFTSSTTSSVTTSSVTPANNNSSVKDITISSAKIERKLNSAEPSKPLQLNNNDHMLADAETNGTSAHYAAADDDDDDDAGDDLDPGHSEQPSTLTKETIPDDQQIAARIISGLEDCIAMDGDRVELITTIVGLFVIYIYMNV